MVCAGCAADEDTIWQATVREHMGELHKRCAAFADMLRARPEAHIAVVSHGVFLEVLWEQLVGPTTQRFMNCELRIAKLE